MIAVGIDLCDVRAIERSIEQFGERFLRRICTEGELAYCTSSPHATAERVAARFAAKEACRKVLGAGPPWWTSIEVVRDANGRPGLVLHGDAARHAAEHGITQLAVSLTHEENLAGAVVMADLRADEHGSIPHDPATPQLQENTMSTIVTRDTIVEAVHHIVVEHGRLARDADQLGELDDLYEAGMTSHSSVNVMLAVEDHFDVEFPDSLLRRDTFQSVAGISDAVAQMLGGA